MEFILPIIGLCLGSFALGMSISNLFWLKNNK